MKLFKRKDRNLNGNAPKYFKDWHREHFLPTEARSKRNEGWLRVILIGIVGSYFVGEKYAPELVETVRAFLGG